ncbi:glycosyltransferase [Desulfovibrio sp. JC022]|uniref:glycosyltransferase family protein n=1 Tax=Desulfovibrio sp. JC022 TaxID=2593642 RepID=UPI001EF1A39E|nr:glycosyltransferase [Desulfovibrio sp. JC022]
MGNEVKYLHGQDGRLDLPAKLDEMDFCPDVILQQESLGRRLFLHGLHKLDCIKVFWSVDTHMNMYWHKYYADLFDCVLTTQKKYVSQFSKACSAKVEWMPWMAILSGGAAVGSGVIPHSRREHDLTFVGRVTEHRRSRLWFVNFLKSQYALNLEDSLNYYEMMSVYRQTRVVPNEALFGEVNFRLFEAAACGCAIVTPDVGGGLGELFEVGREVEVYNDVLELKERLDRFTKSPELSGTVGMAAYARVLKDHLPDSRAAAISEIVAGLSRRNISADRAELLLCMSEFLLGEAGDNCVNWDLLLKRLLSLGYSELRNAALFRIFARSGLTDLFMKIVRPYLDKSLSSSDCYFNMSASLSALKLGQWEVAKHFWYAYAALGRSANIVKPEDDVHLLKLWGDAAFKSGLSIRSGVAFNEDEGIPSCASDCFFAALHRRPSDKELYMKLDSVFNGVKGGEPTRLGFLSHLSLHYPDDWRISAEVAVTSLKVFRFQEGLKELENARVLAEKSGQDRFFYRKMESEIPLFYKLVNRSGM